MDRVFVELAMKIARDAKGLKISIAFNVKVARKKMTQAFRKIQSIALIAVHKEYTKLLKGFA